MRKKQASLKKQAAEEDKKLYIQDGASRGYLNIPWIISLPADVFLIIGGRGTGKTYGFLKEWISRKWSCIFLRRLGTQLDIVKKNEYSPFVKLNKDNAWQTFLYNEGKNITGIYHHYTEDDKGKQSPAGFRYGFMSALNVFQNVRGFDGSDYDYIIYDEFIPQRNERLLKGEADAIFNMYETCNRNRELEGQKPMKLFCLSNSDDITHPLLMQLKVVKQLEKMHRTGKEVYIDQERRLCVIYLQHSPISAAKQNKTVIGRLTKGTTFGGMAYENTFDEDMCTNIKSENLQEYKPVCTVGECTIYKHKSKRHYYVSAHTMGSPVEYSIHYASLERFRRQESSIIEAYFDGHILYEDYYLESLLSKYVRGI